MRSRQQLPFYLAAAIGGAALAYFLDPQQGRRRRHFVRDKAVSLSKHGTRRGRKLVHHVSSDARGYVERARHARGRAEELDDRTLVDKIESIVFRQRDVPKGNININAENGVVFLRGEVERPEVVEALEKRVRKVRGVKGVENLLHTPGQPIAKR
ncbi:MAG TPA: BON domain-containing protein [Gaiellaceae bacterium]|jgi:osmotically-inducible protein OsmY|nr:BON domain-containing protein [Gaiellaceae bacterium]